MTDVHNRAARENQFEPRSAAILGAGRTGTAIGHLLLQLGVSWELATITGSAQSSHLPAKSVLTADFATSAGAAEVVQAINHLLEIGHEVVLFLTLKDDLIAQTARHLSSELKISERLAVVHCAGGLSLDVLQPFADRAARIAVFHPCYPITERAALQKEWGVTFTVQSHDTGLQQFLTRLGAVINATVICLDKAVELNRLTYHAAQVFTCGHLVALMTIAAETLERSGLVREQAHAVIRSLVSGTMKNANQVLLHGSDLRSIVTGPHVRGDEKLIQAQVAALESQQVGLGELYRALGIQGLRAPEED